ncbi:hypothetical protein DFH07DRAFT_784016 [Mycena maculata]|uniref:Uncharacterized protein n=1 Tax=Mycena maculata TaxID=230809 RepID=A0AAD7HK72_9AGAR|nr:hypothetical protein DFH07DRAFT_784016 [Mycena maculata]
MELFSWEWLLAASHSPATLMPRHQLHQPTRHQSTKIRHTRNRFGRVILSGAEETAKLTGCLLLAQNHCGDYPFDPPRARQHSQPSSYRHTIVPEDTGPTKYTLMLTAPYPPMARARPLKRGSPGGAGVVPARVRATPCAGRLSSPPIFTAAPVRPVEAQHEVLLPLPRPISAHPRARTHSPLWKTIAAPKETLPNSSAPVALVLGVQRWWDLRRVQLRRLLGHGPVVYPCRLRGVCGCDSSGVRGYACTWGTGSVLSTKNAVDEDSAGSSAIAYIDHSNFCSTLIIKNSCSGTRPFLSLKTVPAILRERNPPPKKIPFKFVPANLRERNSPPKKFHPKKKSLSNPFPQICGNEIHLQKKSLSNSFPQICGNEIHLQKKSLSNSFPQICGNEIHLKKNYLKKKNFKSVPAKLRERNPPQKKIPFKSVPANLRERNPPPKKIPFKFVPANLRERNSPPKKIPFKFVPANLRERNPPQKKPPKKKKIQIRSRKIAGTKFTSKKIPPQKKTPFKSVPANLRERNPPPKKIPFKFVPANLRERNPPPKKIPFKFVPANLRERNPPPKKIPFKFVPANLRERNPPPKKIPFKFVPANLRERNSPQKKLPKKKILRERIHLQKNSTSKKNPFQIRSRKFAGTKSTSQKNPFQIRSRKFAGTKSTTKKTTQKKKNFKFVPAKLRERNSPPKKFHLKKKSLSNPFPQICGNEIHLPKNPPQKKNSNPFPQNCGNETHFKKNLLQIRSRKIAGTNLTSKKITFKSVPVKLRERYLLLPNPLIRHNN